MKRILTEADRHNNLNFPINERAKDIACVTSNYSANSGKLFHDTPDWILKLNKSLELNFEVESPPVKISNPEEIKSKIKSLRKTCMFDSSGNKNKVIYNEALDDVLEALGIG